MCIRDRLKDGPRRRPASNSEAEDRVGGKGSSRGHLEGCYAAGRRWRGEDVVTASGAGVVPHLA
eukprot:846127-Alexandrium_andersonii.AAC.1